MDFRCVRLDGPIIEACGARPHGLAMLAETAATHRRRLSVTAETANSRGMHGRQGARSDAEQFLDRQAVDDLVCIVRVQAAHAVGLVQVGGDFGQQLVRRNSHRRREPRLELNAAADFAPHRFRAPQQLLTRGDIEKRLVQRQAFDQRRKLMKNRKDLF
jgi:hypothetical protein